MLHIIYASAASTPMSLSDLVRLLRDARSRNGTAGLTGMLLHADGSFLQVLEGEEEKVDDTFERIARDPRHTGVTRIIREPIARRAFSDWSMGFHDVAPEDVANIFGANDFFGAGTCLDTLGPVRARKLLTAFARGRWRQACPGACAAQGEQADAA